MKYLKLERFVAENFESAESKALQDKANDCIAKRQFLYDTIKNINSDIATMYDYIEKNQMFLDVEIAFQPNTNLFEIQK